MLSDKTGAGSLHLRYSIHTNELRSKGDRGSLIDRGANGGILGNDARVIVTHHRRVDVTGIDNHQMTGLKMVDGAGKILTQKGFVIAILRQYAYHGINRTLHAAGQIEHYKNQVFDRAIKCGGRQCIITNDGFVIPLDIINGLPYMRMTPPTDHEYDTLPHVILTSGDKWDPRVLDYSLTERGDWYNQIQRDSDFVPPTAFTDHGDYRHREPHRAPTTTAMAPLDDDPLDTTRVSLVECYRCTSNLNVIYAFDSDQTQPDDTPAEVVPAVEIQPKPVDYRKYLPFFLHVPLEKIRKTFERTTQYATNVMSGHHIKQTIQSPFPAHNVWRRNEPVATNTIFGDTPAVGTGGQTMAQLFVGRKSLVIDVFGVSSAKEFVNTLEDVIRRRGAMDKLISDSATVEISNRVKEILRSLCIDDWQSEPHYQHQNFAEHRWNHLLRNLNWYMNYRNVDPDCWLLCLQWIADVMNHTAEKSLGWRPPLEVLTGQTVDISILLVFMFFDVVYVPRYPDAKHTGLPGGNSSTEIRGRFVGFAWNVGHGLTFKVLTDDTNKIINRSRVRLAKEGVNNLKLDVDAGAIPERIYVKSKRMEGKDPKLPTIDMRQSPFDLPDEPEQGEQPVPEIGESPSPMDEPPLREQPTVETVDDEDDLADHVKTPPQKGESTADKPVEFLLRQMKTDNPVETGLDPDDMIDRTFLMPPAEDGSRVRAKIIERVNKLKDDAHQSPEFIKFKCLVNNEYEEVVAFNDIVDFIEQDQTWDGTWKFREILDHQGPLKPSDPNYKGSRYNLQVEWETGEITWEPLTTAKKEGVYDTDPVTVAIYAKAKNLLDTPGWKLPGLKKRAKTQQRLVRAARQAKLHSFRTKPVYMYGFQVPRNHEQAMELDARNGDTKWRDAETLELAQIDEYKTFDNKGRGYIPDPGYKKIRVHFVYAVKHDGRHKARLVAGGHLTDTPVDSVYSSVVSLRGIRLLTFIAELNKCEVWATDIGNAYLESHTKEKVYIIAGAEFGDREGCTLIISRALYGLKSSGLRWHERFADVLRSMGFFPSRAEPDIWMRDKGDYYEYIAVYVDDLLIVSRQAAKIIEVLEKEHKFKLKGTGAISFHLGCDFFRDEDGTLCYAPRKYIEKVL